jgi:hypothetical protein
MHGQAFPWEVQTIDAAFLSSVLQREGLIEDQRIVRCSPEPVGRQGATSSTFRLWLGYDCEGPCAPRTLIAKLAADDRGTRVVMNALGAYERELRFYAELSGGAGISTPRCYYAAQSLENGAFLLLLEDIPGGPGLVTLDAVEQALCEVARMHARHWNAPELEALGWLERSPAQGLMTQRMLADATQRISARFGRVLPETFARVLEITSGQLESFIARERRRARTLVHGDLHPGNVLCGPRGLTFIDWQGVGTGSPGRDLARLIAMSLPPMPRLSHERRLVATYHAALCENGVRGYSLRDCFQDYRLGLVTSALINAFVLAELDEHALRESAAEGGPTLMDLLVHRIDAALQANAALPVLHAELGLAHAA